MIHPEYCEYEPRPEQNTYQVFTKEYAVSDILTITIAEVQNREIVYDVDSDYERVNSDRYTAKTWKIVLSDFGEYPIDIVVMENDKLYGKSHLGMGFDSDLQFFINKLHRREVGMALRVKIGDLKYARTGKSDDDKEKASFRRTADDYLPAEILDLWLINITDLHSILHWTRDEATLTRDLFFCRVSIDPFRDIPIKYRESIVRAISVVEKGGLNPTSIVFLHQILYLWINN